MATDAIRGAGGQDPFARAGEALRRLAGEPGVGPERGAPRLPHPAPDQQEGAAIIIRFPAERATGVRAAKVREAQARIAGGYYDLPAVRSKLAESLLSSFGLED